MNRCPTTDTGPSKHMPSIRSGAEPKKGPFIASCATAPVAIDTASQSRFLPPRRANVLDSLLQAFGGRNVFLASQNAPNRTRILSLTPNDRSYSLD